VFGIIKSVQGLRQFHQRGPESVRSKWSLESMARNLKRMFTFSRT
jgi:hypothetical protein